MTAIGKVYQPFTEATPLNEIEAVLPADELDELDELDAIGDSRDDQRWKLGDRAREWIDDRRLPSVQICKIIANRADYGFERVRQFLYTSRFYFERPELRQKYNLLRYSIFEHARTCSEPEEVLQAAMNGRLSVTVVKNTYPSLIGELKEQMARIPKEHEQEARLIVLTAIGKLKELLA